MTSGNHQFWDRCHFLQNGSILEDKSLTDSLRCLFLNERGFYVFKTAKLHYIFKD